MMPDFFNPNEHADIIIPMYGSLHMLTLVILLAFIPLLILLREPLKGLCASQKTLNRIMVGYLAFDLFYWVMIWHFQYMPLYERFPFHLCASLSLLLPVSVLLKRYDIIRFFTPWGLAAGFIAFVNPGYVRDLPWSFAFIHYLVRHYFIFILPLALYIGKGYSLNYRLFRRSMTALALYASFIFCVNWATGSNYFHLGKYNPLAIPFLPDSLTAWPLVLPTFITVGVVLIHVIYLIIALSEKRFRKTGEHS
ncbi:MAG: YwaF family protein [Spirochaetales bacterium]|nr:YwaF family protein [Spirochaetales bacterium]